MADDRPRPIPLFGVVAGVAGRLRDRHQSVPRWQSQPRSWPRAQPRRGPRRTQTQARRRSRLTLALTVRENSGRLRRLAILWVAARKLRLVLHLPSPGASGALLACCGAKARPRACRREFGVTTLAAPSGVRRGGCFLLA